jgi:GSCFA family
LSRGPYEQLPDHHFWQRGVALVPPFAIDPLVSVPFKIFGADKIATAGSCFAQHIASALQSNDFNYYVAEEPPEGVSREEGRRRNFGVFSCRYANIYTSRQLLQLAMRAYGRFHPALDVWRRRDGRFIDPFRPLIEPDGYATIDELHLDRATHFAAVRRMLESLDVFIFTFGQTECWRTKNDGAVLPVAPGVAGGEWSREVYEFWNMKADDVTADFVAMVDLLRAVNSTARIIVSVSPVPLAATYEDRHALVSNAYTKATLRVAVDEICAARPNIIYFPAYEIVTASCNAARFYEDDQRNVTPLGVTQVMRIFFKHFAADRPPTASAAAPKIDVAGEAERVSTIVCEEEILGLLSGQ